MSSRSEANFEKRFGNPPRFNVVYQSKSLEGYERISRNKKIVSAIGQVLTGILGRTPTADELTGRRRINEAEIQAHVAGKTE